MSIATLARKSRAQRGASTRTGWTLATTKSGNCPGPCGGGAPAKQHSFRRLMKNKARPGVEQEAHKAPCCTRTQKVTSDPGALGADNNPGQHIGETWVQLETATTFNGSSGTLIEFTEGDGTWTAVFRMNCEPDTQFTNGIGGTTAHSIVLAGTQLPVDPSVDPEMPFGGTAHPPVDTYAGCGCCPPVATWKKTNDPKGEQSIGYYLWRKKQLTHNCIPHCIPHREHYNPNYIYITWTGLTAGTPPQHNTKWQFYPSPAGKAIQANGLWAPVGANPPPLNYPHIFYGPDGHWHADAGAGELKQPTAPPPPALPPKVGWLWQDSTNNDLQIVWSLPGKVCVYDAPCDNVGCKCNCNKSMGGTACCVVHKTMLPLSNSENIAWVVEERTCLQTSKPDPRNPNTC